MRPLTPRTTLLALVFALSLSPAAGAVAEPIEIGGKIAVSADVALDHFTEGNATEFGTGFNVTRVSASGRHEFGGIFDLELAFDDDEDFGLYFLAGKYRINSNPMGPEENILLYAGGNLGVAITTISGGGFPSETDVSVGGGPSVGAEYYFTSSIAIQLEDTVIIYEGRAGSAEVVNSVTIGARILF